MLPARSAIFLRGMLLSVITGFFVVLFTLVASTTYAQTEQSAPSYPTTPNFVAPNVNPDVPQNQHTFVQSIIIEIMAATTCQLIGIDPLSPQGRCLGIDPLTNKIGYAQPTNIDDRDVRVGGLLGSMGNLITLTYTPPVNTADYVNYLAGNFGIVKKTQAQQSGFEGLAPVRNLWAAVRNVTYLLFVITFVIVGLGIMLRVRIDPRTVMTLQNQIPKIIIGILLITFSYAIAGLLVDLMWVTTYVGVNTLTDAGGIDSQPATENILHNPISYLSLNLSKDLGAVDGIKGLTFDVSHTVGGVIEDLLTSIIVGQELNCSFTNVGKTLLNPISYINGDLPVGPTGLPLFIIRRIPFVENIPIVGGFLGGDDSGPGSISQCIYLAMFEIVNWFATFVVFLIILITLIVMLFRVWYMLLKAYAYTIIYVIAAPFWIIAGLLPGSSLGFDSWIRGLFANLAVFPATAFLFIIAKVVIVNVNSSGFFVPPLVGNPGLLNNVGSLIGFGILLLAPELLNMLRDALKKPSSKYGGSIRGGIGRGAAVPSAAGGFAWGRLTRPYNYQTGEQPGPLRQFAAGGFRGPGGPARFPRWYRFTRQLVGGLDPRRER